MAAPSAKMYALPPATRNAKIHAFEQLREVLPSLVASVLLATFSPTIRRSVKGGLAIKEASSPSIQAPRPNFFFTGQLHSLHLLPLHNATFTRVLCNSRVLTRRSGIEAGVDWVNPYRFRASTRILGSDIEVSTD